ncbi:MAG: protein kinase [SAR324 cluster bacterium]|nr:protein kinase [SAR324 cluster bacterium]
MPLEISPQLESLLTQAAALEKWPLGRLISIFEGRTPKNRQDRKQLIQTIRSRPDAFSKNAFVIGFTGTPGAGKSSLIGELCLTFLKKYPDLSIAVVAVDPSSQTSGGSLLGDRTRVNFPTHEKRIFFRSQASNLDLGGVSTQTFHAIRLMKYFFDLIFIETVGIGQSEIEIQKLSDHTCLILQPLTGDQIQFMKAGIMEIPDTFIINKCDEEKLAQKSYHLLKSSLKLARILPENVQEDVRIFRTSAIKRIGLEALAEFLHQQFLTQEHHANHALREGYYLKKWVKEEYGKWGLLKLEELLQSQPEKFTHLTFEDQESFFLDFVKQFFLASF